MISFQHHLRFTTTILAKYGVPRRPLECSSGLRSFFYIWFSISYWVRYGASQAKNTRKTRGTCTSKMSFTTHTTHALVPTLTTMVDTATVGTTAPIGTTACCHFILQYFYTISFWARYYKASSSSNGEHANFTSGCHYCYYCHYRHYCY